MKRKQQKTEASIIQHAPAVTISSNEIEIAPSDHTDMDKHIEKLLSQKVKFVDRKEAKVSLRKMDEWIKSLTDKTLIKRFKRKSL